MANTEAWTDWPIVFDAETKQAGTAEYINGRTVLNPNLVSRPEPLDGDLYNTYVSLVSGAPVANLVTNDLKEFLDECGTTGMKIDSGAAGDGVIIYYQKLLQGGSRSTGAAHQSITIGDGMVIPRSISLPHQGNASLTADIFGVSTDGVTSPLVYSETATLPSVYPKVDEVFTLGKVDLNGTEVLGKSNVTINFGIQELIDSADSNVYPTVFSIMKIQPSIMITGREIDITATLTEAGLEYITDVVIVYAQKRDEGGTLVAAGTAEHLKFTMGKCRADVVSIGGGPTSTLGILITPWYTSGVTPKYPITISTASAIT